MRYRRPMGGFVAVALAAGISAGCGESSGASLDEGKAVFTRAGCGVCHTLSDAGSKGTVGPDLDEVQPSAEVVEGFVTNGMGQMPSFRSQLSEKEIKAVAAYVSDATGGNEE